jgi:hypothetical protein
MVDHDRSGASVASNLNFPQRAAKSLMGREFFADFRNAYLTFLRDVIRYAMSAMPAHHWAAVTDGWQRRAAQIMRSGAEISSD